MLYVWHSCIKAGHFVLHSITGYHGWKILYVIKPGLGYHIAHYKGIIQQLYTIIQQTVKQEHTHCRHLALFTFALNTDSA